MSSKKLSPVVIIAFALVGFVAVVFMVNVVRVMLRPKPVIVARATPHRSPKAQKAEAMANAVTERQCLDLDRVLRSPYHEIKPHEMDMGLNCQMLRERAANRGAWESALDLMDEEARR